jgi:hypothetical protein
MNDSHLSSDAIKLHNLPLTMTYKTHSRKFSECFDVSIVPPEQKQGPPKN